MGYQNPNVVKSVFFPQLPADRDDYTLEEYKNLYGIDLYDFLKIKEGDNIQDISISPSGAFKVENTLFYCVGIEGDVVPAWVEVESGDEHNLFIRIISVSALQSYGNYIVMQLDENDEIIQSITIRSENA